MIARIAGPVVLVLSCLIAYSTPAGARTSDENLALCIDTMSRDSGPQKKGLKIYSDKFNCSSLSLEYERTQTIGAAGNPKIRSRISAYRFKVDRHRRYAFDNRAIFYLTFKDWKYDDGRRACHFRIDRSRARVDRVPRRYELYAVREDWKSAMETAARRSRYSWRDTTMWLATAVAQRILPGYCTPADDDWDTDRVYPTTTPRHPR
jgi:hypothetical protein